MVVVGHLDGEGMAGPYREVLYLLNVSPDAQALVLPEEAGKAYELHPVQAAADAADARARQAAYRARDGRIELRQLKPFDEVYVKDRPVSPVLEAVP